MVRKLYFKIWNELLKSWNMEFWIIFLLTFAVLSPFSGLSDLTSEFKLLIISEFKISEFVGIFRFGANVFKMSTFIGIWFPMFSLALCSACSRRRRVSSFTLGSWLLPDWGVSIRTKDRNLERSKLKNGQNSEKGRN